MGTGKRKTPHRVKNLAAGRPPTARLPKSLSRKTTKRLINSHHQLEKRRLQAVARGDAAAEAAIAAEIDALGGLARYQQASLQGQRRDRGGDSSRVLMQWLSRDGHTDGHTEPKAAGKRPLPPALLPATAPLRMLEVGALSTDNACSASGVFRMERIDLHSQGPGILQQDFLQRPRPQSAAERFDLISLSLVLNYVPQPSDRGEMLLRCLDFLHEPGVLSADEADDAAAADVEGLLLPTQTKAAWTAPAATTHAGMRGAVPSVFMVLPEPCVTNSRYLTEEHLAAVMAALGFDLLKSKRTQRLAYYLWKRVRPAPTPIPSFAKKELRSGSSRNNFSIVVQGT
ncbi:hypothetical protein SPI_06767 [Niveomyces insectorum RCEF 264]|uniref:25S rRNA adenine-N(1) methyltransferase n=1 Tax=Niveomyces insectorum RCEF 264 TaxID=1081102 RepID=A0A167QRC3_9HYPO|nr:hypothetical protein SPI_06767 [Niveomyces insectorum RCEF 264]